MSNNVSQLTTLSELPALVVSTTKAFRFRPFEMSIILSKQWMLDNRISSEMVLSAGFNTKCCFENNPNEPVGPCKKCGSKKKTLITIKTSSKAVFGPHEIAPGVLKFTFNLCRSHCTSSRDHLRSRILLVVDGLKGVVLRSPPIVLRSREKGALPQSVATPGCLGIPGTASISNQPLGAMIPPRPHSSESEEETPHPLQQSSSPFRYTNAEPVITTATATTNTVTPNNGSTTPSPVSSVGTTMAPGLEYSAWYFAQQEAARLQPTLQSESSQLTTIPIDQQPSLLQQAVMRDPFMSSLIQPVMFQQTDSLLHQQQQQQQQQQTMCSPAAQRPASSFSSSSNDCRSLPSLSELFPDSGFGCDRTLPPLGPMGAALIFSSRFLPPPQ